MIHGERFAVCMRRLLDEKGVTVTDLTRALGYKSRNSLFRILNDQSGSDVESSFFHLLKEKDPLKLNAEQWDVLEEALEISRLGLEDFRNNRAIKALVMAEPFPRGGLKCIQHEEREEYSFSEVLEQFAKCSRVDITIFSCCNVALFGSFADCFAAAGESCQVSMTHFMFAGKEEIIHNLMAVQPVLYKSWYKAYFITPGICAPETEALLRASGMLIHAVGQEERWWQMVMLDSERILCSSVPGEAVSDVLQDMLERMGAAITPLKSEFDDLTNSGEDYLRYTDQYRQLEQGCRIFSLKPDVPINYIHPDILISPVMDGFSQAQVADQQDMEQLIRALYDVQLKRYNNFFTKKKVTHTVFSIKAMERFVNTGTQSDHFFAIRPYTKAERKAILVQLREQAVNNPFFWVYFLNDKDMEMRAELTLYEGRGMMFMQADTKYNLAGDHNEALVNHPALNEKFKNFFMKDLLVHHVMEYNDGMAELDRLIRSLE